ncbi:ABC transporter permease [Capnocytophaga canis]|uniref:ABC transporter permease n=1 Tax=Capnocytophaga TaxID=1016 RepID=UPI000BB1BA4C|nr:MULTISPECIES: ABC transporter permease [Capnocytophaga]ATA75105.1 hypothetical protein CGC52_06545 [Capnocytophaga sp. H2931]GIM61589.1 membrane protein [Capnocytophaga canis]
MRRISRVTYAYMQEMKRIISDSAVWASFFIISIIVAWAYTYVYSYEVTNDVHIAVVDECRTSESRQLIRMINATEQVSVSESPSDFDAARELFYQGKVHGIVVIPRDFSEKIYKKMRPSVSGYYDVAYFIYYKQVYKAVATSIAYMNAGIELKGLTAQGISNHQAMNTIKAINAQTVTLFNPNGGYATFAMPMVYLLIIQTLLLTGIGLLGGTQREKKEFLQNHYTVRTIRGVIATLLGKAGSYLTIALLYITIVLGIIMPFFDIPQRAKLIDVYLFMLPFFLSVAFMGLFLIRFFKHREDAVMTISFTSIPFLILSGISWPVESLPKLLQFLSQFIPSTTAIKGFVSLTQGGVALTDIHDMYLKMWLICLFYFVLCVFFFNSYRKKNENELV